MRVFVAGATGVLGRRAVRSLVEAGHVVSGLARSDERAALLRSLGAVPVAGDLFDARAMTAAVAGHEVVCNLATHIPPASRVALSSAWAENHRIRREGSATLVDAAIAAGAKRYIQESIAFCYRDRGSNWIGEDDELDLPDIAATVRDAEAAAGRFTAAGGTGVVLRFGMFYGWDSDSTQSMVALVRQGISPYFDPGAYTPSIATDDAAAAVVAALRVPAGVYNVVDEPVTHRELVDSLARALDVRPPQVLPAVAGRALGGAAATLSRSQRVSGRRFRDATGWRPRWSRVSDAWPAVVAAMPSRPATPRRPGLARSLLGLLLVAYLVQGAWALFAPRAFYDGFPGFGRHWVAGDGPFNEHLVRDVGGLSLALATVLGAAAVTLRVTLVRVAAAAALVFGLPHVLYHAFHLDTLVRTDQVASLVMLGLGVVLPIAVLAIPVAQPRRDSPQPAP